MNNQSLSEISNIISTQHIDVLAKKENNDNFNIFQSIFFNNINTSCSIDDLNTTIKNDFNIKNGEKIVDKNIPIYKRSIYNSGTWEKQFSDTIIKPQFNQQSRII